MASIQKHGDKWRALVLIHGRRVSKVCDTKREAQQWALQQEALADSGDKGITFGYACKHYMKTVTVHKRGKSPAWEAKRFELFLEFFGEATRLSAITSKRIGEWRDHRLITVQGSTVVREAVLLRHLFRLARDEWKWITESPFTGARLPKENDPRSVVWRWYQIKRVLRAGQRAGGATWEAAQAFRIALHTGLRLQEALKAPEMLDTRLKVLNLPSTKVATKGEVVPLTRRGYRVVSSTPPLKVNPNEASALFSRLSKHALISGLQFRDARATALTLLARKVDILTLARISRHRNLDLLRGTYYRERPEEISARLQGV